ncbi:MAG: hypothetical protein NZZ41_07385, partial [Candidatus Dojkabacteria bacterium]|nr:hypothetical protein [Candidatus Dojkabacteria bacterium]
KGDVVKLASSTGGNWKKIAKTTSRHDQAIGIISSNPTIVMGKSVTEGGYPVGLAGVLPTKVSDQNGLIRRGDFVTVSDIPGHAMKANLGDLTLGIALEDQITPIDKINVLVSRNNIGSRVEIINNLDTEEINNNINQSVQTINNRINTLENYITELRNQINSLLTPVTPEETIEDNQDSQGNNIINNHTLEFIARLSSILQILDNNVISFQNRVNIHDLFAPTISTNKLVISSNRSGEITFTYPENEKILQIEDITDQSKIFISFIDSASKEYIITRTSLGFKITINNINENETVRIHYLIIN